MPGCALGRLARMESAWMAPSGDVTSLPIAIPLLYKSLTARDLLSGIQLRPKSVAGEAVEASCICLGPGASYGALGGVAKDVALVRLLPAVDQLWVFVSVTLLRRSTSHGLPQGDLLSNRNPAAQSQSGHYPALDGVRGIAVLIVIVHNSAWIAGESQQFFLKLVGAITSTGWIGVQIFFALSGFLITGILLDTKDHPRYLRSFYLRRTLRIFPVYYTMLALVFFVGPHIVHSSEWIVSVRRNQWSYWVYLQNWITPFHGVIRGLSHLWSLAVEEQFYLFWPLVVLLATRRGLVKLCFVVIVGTPFIRLGLRMFQFPPVTAYEFTIARWDALAAGALVAVFLQDETGRRLLADWQGRVALLAGLALGVLVAVQHGLQYDDFGTEVIGQSLVALLSVSLVAYAVASRPQAPPQLREFLSRPGLRAIGKYSYAMYLFHLPILELLQPHFEAWVRGADTPLRVVRLGVYILTVLVLTFLAALVSWRLIEKPFLDLKDKIAPRPA